MCNFIDTTSKIVYTMLDGGFSLRFTAAVRTLPRLHLLLRLDRLSVLCSYRPGEAPQLWQNDGLENRF
jgi:hypothetical protein